MQALQFGDSMLPVGAFSFSNGLESAIQQRIVHDAPTLRQFVETAIAQATTGDGIALLEAHRGASANDLARVAAADHAVYCRKLNEETRTMTVRMGRKLAELATHVAPDVRLLKDWLAAIQGERSPGCYPAAQGVVFAALDVAEQQAFAVHHYGVASMILGAALRLMKISYLDAQSILFGVNQTAAASYERIASAKLDDMCTFAPVTDILAAVHVKSHVRMFMN